VGRITIVMSAGGEIRDQNQEHLIVARLLEF
jgi:hypothetical protein